MTEYGSGLPEFAIGVALVALGCTLAARPLAVTVRPAADFSCMQQLPDGSFRFSPRDLISYLEGDFAAWCERNHAERNGGTGSAVGALTPDEHDEEADLAARRGIEHERAHLASLRQRHSDLAEISDGNSAFETTQLAMSNGASVIYQGELRANGWRGISDFLHKKDGDSNLGDFHYEPWDTKLARSAKPYFLLQMSAYAEMLEAMQGLRPESLGFVLGDGAEKLFRTADVWHYYQRLKRSFEAFHQSWSRDARPNPALEKSWGRWTTEAERHLRETDDIKLVAGITQSQCVRLREAGISTVAGLATRGADSSTSLGMTHAEPYQPSTPLGTTHAEPCQPSTPLGTTHAEPCHSERSAQRAVEESAPSAVPRISRSTYEKLREQAAMQMGTRTKGSIQWKLRPVDEERPRRGLALLPPASRNDIFFDIEGFPYATDGLEYLLGVVTVDTGTPVFRDWWSHDEREEKTAFESFIDFAYARWQEDPTLHIYHYAAYERTAICRLMGKYGTREFQVDELLRNEVLVDLYTVTLQGLCIGTESYSLKYIEPLYMGARTGDVKTAGGSVVEYQRWIDANESPDPSQSPILGAIRDYNRIDCESTVGLRDWLLDRQKDAGLSWLPPAPPNEPSAELTEVDQLASDLLAHAETLVNEEERRVTTLVANLLQYYRREEKPWWWEFFDRMKAPDERLVDDPECLGALERTDTPSRVVRRSRGYEYRFDPGQDTKVKEGERYAVTGTEGLTCVIERFVDREAGIVELASTKPLPDRLSLIPARPVSTGTQRDALMRFVPKWRVDKKCEPAIDDLLSRRAPRLIGGKTFTFASDGDATAQAVDVVKQLDNSLLCIQGPPGTGKTRAAAEMIVALMAAGKRVGVVSSGHQVILNLIERVVERGDERGVAFDVIKAGDEKNHPLAISGRMQLVESKAVAGMLAADEPKLVGGTAWLYARPEMEGTLDYLYIEEAGQFSLANAVASASAAKNLVLLGDQMQLPQVTQGSHPGESGNSVLEYYLSGHATVPPELGIFLGASHRMHPDICAFISDAYYEGRLTHSPLTAENRVIPSEVGVIPSEVEESAPPAFPSFGLCFIPVKHDGNTTDSAEECEVVQRLVKELLKCNVRIKGEAERPMTIADILIVAPFNMQVAAIKKYLPNARVGSVDRFQGQEAPVVIVTMCASSLEDAPRGPKFLLSKNRLNVAISRAQALAIVVGSPAIGDVRVKSIDELLLVSGWCRVEQCSGCA